MQVDKVSFQAQVPSRLKNKLFMDAYTRGKSSTEAFTKQLKNVESWGLDTTTIAEHIDCKKRGVNHLGLSLFNSYFAPFKHVELPQKETVYETFMALTEHIVTEAENKLKI